MFGGKFCKIATVVHVAIVSIIDSYPGGKGGAGGGGNIYYRWGKKNCPHTSSHVYHGQMVGPDTRLSGGGSNFLCLPDEGKYEPAAPRIKRPEVPFSTLKSVYYQDTSFMSTPPEDRPADFDKVPCVACELERSLIMIPGTLECPTDGWSSEYQGFLASTPEILTKNKKNKEPIQHYRMMYVCVDREAQSLGQGPSDPVLAQGSSLVLVTAECDYDDSVAGCPPYQSSVPLSCVVCRKDLDD